MLAKTNSPSPRLPKNLKERGQPRQYDVPREHNQLKVNQSANSFSLLKKCSLQSCVREFAHHLLGQMPWDVPSEGELLAFENGRGTGPTATSFRLALASQGLANRWNAQAAEIFADAFLSEDELSREFSDREAILLAFIVHLITLQKRHRQPILRAMMTEAEVNGERNKQKQKAREQRKRGVGYSIFPPSAVFHTLQLFRRRMNATKDYEADHLLKTLSTSFWAYCTPEVMSDDETDSEWDGPVNRAPHFIKTLKWCNPDVINFFRVLDALYFSTRFKGNKWSPGRFPHTRVPSVRLKGCDAVPGLPVNFYRPQWLLQLSDIERRKLKTRPAIDLTFSRNILRLRIILIIYITSNRNSRIAARFLHIRHRKQLPLPRDHPALLAITMSTFPSGFPLENVQSDQHHQAPNEELLMQPNIVSTAVSDALHTSHLSHPVLESLSLSKEDAPQFMVPTLTMESNSPHTPNIVCPVSPVPFVGLPGENLSRPQIFLVDQSIEGSSSSYLVALGTTLRVPTHSSHTAGLIPESPNITPASSAGRSTYSTDLKRIEPFIPRKQLRHFIKKGKGKAS